MRIAHSILVEMRYSKCRYIVDHLIRTDEVLSEHKCNYCVMDACFVICTVREL